MSNKFTIAMQFVALHEWGNRADGAYTNDPRDPGGETKFGISKRAHPDVDIQSLTLVKALQIYQDEYWKYESLPLGLSICAFDTAVNMGASVAEQFLKDCPDARTFLERRRQKYLSLGKKKPAFLKGWLNRVNDLSKFVAIQEAVEGPV